VDDLRAFYRGHYRPDNATLLVVGDVTPASVLPMLEKSFGGWKADGMAPLVAAVPTAPQLTKRQVYLIDKPGAAQSQIRIGWVGVPRSTPDYAALTVMNTLLGGAFTSRLNQNLREKNGFTYGASSLFDMRISAGPFLATAGVQTDKTADALREFFVELNGILDPIPADELTKAKNNVALGFPAEFETTGDMARKLEELVIYGLPDDTFSSFVAAVNKVSGADVQRAAARYVQPDRMAVVVVGDRAAVEANIKALNLGPIQIVPIDDLFR
jgi:predicted Zn-dependent peptidase